MKTFGAALLLGSLTAAQTFVVDAGNGPGTNFTEIAAAVAAVPDGAVLDVRPGTYLPFRIAAKSMSVLGRPGVTVSVTVFDPTAIDVVDLASQQTVTLRGLALDTTFGFPRLVCRDCDGTVVIDSCATGSTQAIGAQLVVSGCERVFVHDSTVTGSNFLTATVESFASNLVLDGCLLRSAAFCIRQGGGRVHVSGCRLESTAPVPTLPTALCFLAGGQLLLNASTELVGVAGAIPAAAGTGSVVVDPDTVLQNLATPPFDPGLALASRAIPRLSASTQGLGGAASATLAVPAGSAGYLYVGLPDAPSGVVGVVDPVWIASPVLEASGGSPSVSGSYPVPGASWALGVAVAWQGVVVAPNGAIAVSNPAAYVHH